MEQRQIEKKTNQAAEEFAGALRESYRVAAETGRSVQQINEELTRRFFDGVINSLRAQEQVTQDMSREVVDQLRSQQEAARTFAQESANSSAAFLDSLFSYYQSSGVGGRPRPRPRVPGTLGPAG